MEAIIRHWFNMSKMHFLLMKIIYFYEEIVKYISVSHTVLLQNSNSRLLFKGLIFFPANSADGSGNSRRHGVPECEEVYTQVRL